MSPPFLTTSRRRDPRPELLHELFEAQAEARPGAVAVACGSGTTTYHELERQANRIARRLRARGVRRGSCVGVLLPRSPDAYAAILGAMKAGAAYVPLDPEYPPARISAILEDCRAAALVTNAELARGVPGFAGEVVRVDVDRAALAQEDAARIPRREIGLEPGDLCYVVYTSGSTGRPKGVMIEHRSACHLVRAEGRLFDLRSDDRVYQGFSLAFDASVEEVWLAFRAGATLVPATPEMARAGPDLSRMLVQARVTVFSCVPTVLSMLTEDVPTLRLLILGGEPCPRRLAARWTRPGRRVVNTYGPTEATVIATWAELMPGKPVSIGRPLPGYRVEVRDERLRPVPRGKVGEICIGGVGVARGYVGRPDETRDRFVPDPYAAPDEPTGRLYRTGDLGRLDAEGELHFVGRADGQVKIRGFRVELSEIEAAMMQCDGIRAAACTVREDVAGVPQLVGYVVPNQGEVHEADLRAHLWNLLPAYMVPDWIESIDELPRMPSGKLDRTSLPAPRARDAAPHAPAAHPSTATERRIAEVWAGLFSGRSVSVRDDFFLDLGGHSLLAARMVSELRKVPGCARVSVLDVYEHRTIAALAAGIDAGRSDVAGAEGAEPTAAEPGGRSSAGERWSRRLAGAAQTAGLYFALGFRAFEWITPYLVFFLLLESGRSVLASAAWAVAAAAAIFPALVGTAIAVKWLVLGRIRPGRHPVWGAYYVRWWFVQTLVSAVPLDYLGGTPLLPFVYRLLGARIGKDVELATENLAAFDLISIGDGTSVDDDASLLGSAVEGGELIVGPVTVGRGCFVGTRAVLRDGAVLEDGARLEDLSLLPRGARVPRGETWAGSPAKRTTGPRSAPPTPRARGTLLRAATAALYAFLVLSIPVLLLAAIVPGVALMTALDPSEHPWEYLLSVPLVGASFVVLLAAEIVLVKWALVGRVRPGSHPVHGSFYVRNWMVDQMLALSLDVIAPLRATLYLAPWYRALGARLGRFVELSTATSTTPDLLEIDEGGTIADEASLGAARVEGGWMTVARTRIGHRAFVGNSAVVPAGTELGEGSLVGVLSVPPPRRSESRQPGAAWLGSPPVLLPRREPSAGFSEERTYRPPRRLVLARAAAEVLRVTLPPAGFVLVTSVVVRAALELQPALGLGATLLLLPIVYAACCAAALAALALAKWTLIGRYRPFTRPLWTTFLWRLELVNALYEFLATPLALDALQGTPWLPLYFRVLGAKVGRGVYAHTTGLLEWDLVEIGHRVALNDDCVLQTHLFEDRVLKASRVRIADDASVGALSVVLYDSAMEEGSRLDALSLLMKGETLPAGTEWAGIPAAWRSRVRAANPEDRSRGRSRDEEPRSREGRHGRSGESAA